MMEKFPALQKLKNATNRRAQAVKLAVMNNKICALQKDGESQN